MSRTADQYRIIATGAGWIDRGDRGRLRFEGRDASKFLQALLTNDIQALMPGTGAYAAYLTPQGRMIADLRVHHCGDHLLAQVAAGDAAALAQRFDQLIFSEDVRVTDVSASIAQVAVVGQDAAALIARAFGADQPDEHVEPARLVELPPLAHVSAGVATIARGDDLDLPVFDIFLPAADRSAAVERLGALGVVPVSTDLFEALRIEAGRPAFGVDMTGETIPLEAGLLDRGISTTKGCYVGQEIIIRVLHRGGGRVARRLARLRFDTEATVPPPAGTVLLHDGRDVGRVTSSAVSLSTGRVVALGYVHRDQAEPGVRVQAQSAPAVEAEIVGFAG